MKITQTKLEGVLLIEPSKFTDDRGYFFEAFKKNVLAEGGVACDFVQDNQSTSKLGVIRGLHYQRNPHAQAKLVRVLKGKVRDVVVDLRHGSPTYKQWIGVELSDENLLQVFIPRGFAHGFCALTDDAVLMYKCDDYYAPETEGGIRYDDPELNIDWGVPSDKAIVSPKDLELPFLKNAPQDF
ncbi:MAG: dTDP-4-dehydrorhamnose 3,5-epimerase [Patescibacteria group bacterium]|nr:dTDP-4-dehydrorhamnose 3,5-epimerase [Patescibacteria group bacterium]